LVGRAAGEGWNPGLADAPALHAADPGGFLGAFVGDEFVAGISAVAYGDVFGFIGLYICRPELRGHGHGKAVWDAGMARLAGRTVGLDGVEAQQANYRSMGFAPSYKTVRWSGPAPEGTRNAAGIVDVTSGMLPELDRFDRRFFPGPRTAFLAAWTSPPRLALAMVDGGQIRGCGVARRCGDGVKIGPLYAEAPDIATALLTALAARLPTPTVLHIDVPEPSEAFTQWLRRHGFAKGFETMRMYRGPAPVIEQDGVFGVSTLELG
jgi:hypothetical protein